jgi:hypothetical protein
MSKHLVDVELKRVALERGILDPDYALLASRENVRLDDQHAVLNAAAAIDQLKELKPHLFRVAAPVAPPAIPKPETPKAIKPGSPEAFAALAAFRKKYQKW